MFQQKWFKYFIWIISSAFFFIASSVLISYWNPGSEEQSMKYMSGMMKAMETSFMGLSMSLESNAQLAQIIKTASLSLLPLIVISVLFSIYILLTRRNANAKKK